MIATVTLYYNTGFNPTNIPDSPTLLNSMSSDTFNSNYVIQDSLITECTIEATWDEVKNADYLKLNNTYFFIVTTDMINENCANVKLQVDALTTLGGPAALTYSGGVINRAHALSDDLFANVIEEDITPQKALQLVSDYITGDDNTQAGNITLVGSTLSLTEPGVIETVTGKIVFTDPNAEHAFTFKGTVGTEEYTLTLPETPPLAPESVITIGTKTGKLSAVGLYNEGTSGANIRYLRMMNLDGAILYCYKIPTQWGGQTVCVITDDNGHTIEQGVSGKLNLASPELTIANAPNFERSDYTARNKKVYALYSTIRVSFDLSGDEQIFDTPDLYSTGDIKPSFGFIMDPQPNGYFIVWPRHFQNNSIGSYNFKSVHGAKWKSTPIAFNTEAGSLIGDMDYKNKVGKLKQEYWAEFGTAGGVNAMINGAQIAKGDPLMGAVLGGTGHLGKAIGEGISGGRHLYNPLNELKYENYKRNIVVPDLTSNPAVGLTNILKEKLHVQLIAPSVSDLIRFDRYFDYYGYAMGGEPFKKEYLSGRQYCNYIKCSDVHITSNSSNFGLAIKTEGERMLNNGIRIWHVKPQPLTSNPIV